MLVDMLPTPPHQNGFILPFLEGGMTLAVCALVIGWPRLGFSFFPRIERSLASIAHRPTMAVTLVGLANLLLRLALLPLIPIPLPSVPNDFSFLLAADTFAHGRITNPTPAIWMPFESIHITMLPSYQSMYFPGQGLLLAAGQLIFGNPWWAQMLVTALMSAAICWMLQAWLPSTWALLGGLIAVLHLGLFSDWINTGQGASLLALAGALVLGAYPRFRRHQRMRDAWIMAIGIAILVLSRPYEGLLLCIPVLAGFLIWLVGSRRSLALVARRTALPLAFVACAVAWLGYYDLRAFGHATTLPYTLNRAQYAVAPYYVWQPQLPDPGYHHPVMRRFYYEMELPVHTAVHSLSGFLTVTPRKFLLAAIFYAGFALLPPLIMAARVVRDRRTRFLLLVVALMVAGMSIEIFMVPHYLAPFTAALYALGLQAMRHLRQVRLEGKPTGLTLTRLLVAVCLLTGAARALAGPLHIPLVQFPVGAWTLFWYGPGHFGTERAQVQADLAHLPGDQLVLVRYSAGHYPADEWVYNSADLDHSKVLWAREMDPATNQQLIRHYNGRTAWLLEPDKTPALLTPYPLKELAQVPVPIWAGK
jgi:hypothetical protein